MALTRVRVPECPEDADESWFEGIFAKAGRRVRAVSPSHLPTTNFASIIRTYRVAFEDESEEDGASSIQCLVKFTPPDPDTRNLLCGIYRFFGRELEVYEKLLPDMESFLKGKGMTLDLFPRFYGGGERAEDAKGYVVLEDLGPLGYRALKNVKDLDEPHAFLALHALARLHAFSYAFLQSHPVHSEDYDRTVSLLCQFQKPQRRGDKWGKVSPKTLLLKRHDITEALATPGVSGLERTMEMDELFVLDPLSSMRECREEVLCYENI
ncbi:unnamed protein product [Darwinula stevensoni]|uniref:CHK kinase-like domain-containing protein n=1 Tax=Darwinula stevensoni TaxID=69355 RepID=A0A7R8X7C9_9CRUS|nr:unnamed protein product [Darwinula stevensoni]CAG0886742.1 unnamed protein product [Darwinula stevensoni]